jgi:hypothetical protein
MQPKSLLAFAAPPLPIAISDGVKNSRVSVNKFRVAGALQELNRESSSIGPIINIHC